jgi:hypothetical protein
MKRLLTVFVALLLASPLLAQQNNANQTQLRLTIVDQLGGGVPAATVVIVPPAGEPVTVMSDERGIATAPTLTPGQVTVKVEFPGFEPFEAPLTLRRGTMNETVTLKIEGFKEEVQVSDSTAAEASRSASTITLTQEEIDALPDDPEELAEYLSQLAGPGGATFFMNGFSGGRLPTRDEIRSIRFRQNNFAADNHDAGRAQVDIITRPNTNFAGNGNLNFGSDKFNARQPQQAVETPSQERTLQFGVRGPIVAGRTSFNLNANGRNNYSTTPLIALDDNRNRIGESAQQSTDQKGFTIGLDHSLTTNQSLQLNFQRSETQNLNSGVGGFNLPERASNRSNDSNQLRFRLQGLVGKSSLNEVRLQVNRSGSEASSLSSAQTIVIQDYRTSGGAGVNSRARTDTFEFADNFDFNAGPKHAMRVGMLLTGAQYSNFDERNAAGTFTFSTIENFQLGLPSQFSQRIGAIDTKFTQYQAGFYWSDEFRMHRNFTLGFGVRNEMQSRIDDKLNLMPRIGFTLAPWGSQTTAIRGGYGLFHDWYESGLYDQTLRLNGISTRDIRISNPGYPNPFLGEGTLSPVTPSGRVQAAPDLKLPRVHQASISMDRQVSPIITVQTSYTMLRGENQMRSRNLNVPVDRVRPNPEFGDITQFESTGRSHSDRLSVGTRFRFQIRQGTPQQQFMMFNVNYTLGKERNHADSATSLPSDNLNPDVDWGPSRQDIRHRVQMQAQFPLILGFRSNVNFNASSGAPYNWTTGDDDNNDGAFNDRPLGVGRNALRGEPNWGLNMNLNRRFQLGGLRTPANPANSAQGGALFAQQGGGGRGGGGFGGQQQGGRGGNQQSRYSMELSVQATNVLNHVSRTGYSGNQQSDFFRRTTNVSGGRDINVSLRFNF